MGTITYSARFTPGTVATAASLDTAFSAVSSAWTGLSSANFRRFAGIKNSNKAKYHSVSLGGLNIRTLTFDQVATANYYSLFSYPHSNVVDTYNNLATPSVGTVVYPEVFKIKNVQAVYDSITGSHESDVVQVGVLYVKAGAKNPGFGSAGTRAGGAISAFAAGTISSVDYTITDAIACHLYLYIAPRAETIGTRTLTNLSAWVTLEIPHVSR
jgi:hypothetical protein